MSVVVLNHEFYLKVDEELLYRMSQYVRIADRVACWELFIEEIASEMVVASELGLDVKAILKNISNISPTNISPT